jgi:glycine cleavage system pyridoxal-binding protein P
MYDGSTAAAEGVLMAHRVTKRGKAVLSGGLHPHYRQVIETVSRGLFALLTGKGQFVCQAQRIRSCAVSRAAPTTDDYIGVC